MKDRLVEIQVLYEIAMSIGNHQQLEKMLEHSLSVILRKLNCSAGAVLGLKASDNNTFTIEPIFSIPRRITHLSAYRSSIRKVPAKITVSELKNILKTIPLVGTDEDNFSFHILELPGYGFLILYKANCPLETSLLYSLRPINEKLAASCQSCIQNEKMKHLVHELKLENSERKKAEFALKDSYDLFLTVMDSIDATIYVSDMNTHEILYMNKYMKDSFGGDFKGEICYRVFRHETKPCRHCTNSKLVDLAGNPAGVEVWEGYNLITKKWYINFDRAIKWIDGRLVRLQIATDITKLKNMEEQLRQSQKMEAIGTLAGGIAHDINNMLFPLIGYAELLRDEIPPNSPLQSYTNGIIHAAMRLKDLVRQILTFSRQNKIDLKPIRLQPILDDTIKLIRASLPTAIDIQKDIAPECGIVFADPTQIQQIIMNLATNAYHAMEHTGGRLAITLEQSRANASVALQTNPGNAEYAVITVSDSGTGMEKEVMEKLFDPYFTTKETGKGTGLGLSIVQGIVKSCDGEIRVSSEPGKGTDFRVYLPIVDHGPTECDIHPGEPVPGGTEEIILVDDEESIVQIQKQILERLGYKVTDRTGSVEALQAFKADPTRFDLLITDLTMPNMTGLELADEVKKIRPDIPVIVCSGFSDKIDKRKLEPLVIQGFILKPVVRREFAAAIRRALDGSGRISGTMPKRGVSLGVAPQQTIDTKC